MLKFDFFFFPSTVEEYFPHDAITWMYMNVNYRWIGLLLCVFHLLYRRHSDIDQAIFNSWDIKFKKKRQKLCRGYPLLVILIYFCWYFYSVWIILMANNYSWYVDSFWC